jgi:hypothetical protein
MIMGNFLSLIAVENKKLWKRISTVIMIPILIALVFAWGGLEKLITNMVMNEAGNQTTSQSQSVGNWKDKLKAENTMLQKAIDEAEKSEWLQAKHGIDSDKRKIAENEYRINHDMEPSKDGNPDFWEVVTSLSVWSFIALLAVIACTALVAGEFSEGTMKTMIPRPFTRWQILTAKLIVVVLYTLVLTVVAFISALIVSLIFFGSHGIGDNVFLWIGGKIFCVPGLVGSLADFGLNFLTALVYVIFTFAICAMSRSRALATGLSIFLMLGGSFTTELAMNFSWGKYIFFADTNFSYFITKGAPFYGITLASALIICAAYCVAFLAAGYVIFMKRDIA